MITDTSGVSFIFRLSLLRDYIKRMIQHYFYVHMMHTEEIFDDPQVMENRKAKLSIWEQYRNRKGLCRDRHDILSFA